MHKYYKLFALASDIMYSGKLSREKAFVNFQVVWLFVEVFFPGGSVSFVAAKVSNLRKFSP